MASRPRRMIALSLAAASAIASAGGCHTSVRLRGRDHLSAPRGVPAIPDGGERLPPASNAPGEMPQLPPVTSLRAEPVAAPPIPSIIETSGSRAVAAGPTIEPSPLPKPSLEPPPIQATSVRAQNPASPPMQVELPSEPPILTPPVPSLAQEGPKDEQIRAVVLEAMTRPEPKPNPTPPPSKPAVPDQVKPAPLPPKSEPPPSPDQVWRETLERLRTLARSRAAESTGGNEPEWTLRHRVLTWMADPSTVGEEWTSGDGLAAWRVLLDALKIAATRVPGEESRVAPAQAKTLREAVRTLEARVPLEITELALCRKVNGFGDFETMTPPTRAAGQPLVIYAELDGLSAEQVDNGYRCRLSSRVELFADGQTAPVWSRDLGTAEDRCRRRRRDFYVNNRFSLPDSIKPGEYRLRLTESDLVSGKSAFRETPLTITP